MVELPGIEAITVDQGTVARTDVDGKAIYGVNSNALTYVVGDRLDAMYLRDRMIDKYPDVMNTENVGQMPNNAIFHAEATVLLRAARADGGTLSGRNLHIRVDRKICRDCRTVLPYVAMELGNPVVTFADPRGVVETFHNGMWRK
ncbi:MAG: deaminase [Hyphomicrobium sp.]|nr:hypothetical protein [Hyphomicrobium sp.]